MPSDYNGCLGFRCCWLTLPETNIHSGNQHSNGKWTRIEDVFPNYWKWGIIQPAMLVYRRVAPMKILKRSEIIFRGLALPRLRFMESLNPKGCLIDTIGKQPFWYPNWKVQEIEPSIPSLSWRHRRIAIEDFRPWNWSLSYCPRRQKYHLDPIPERRRQKWVAILWNEGGPYFQGGSDTAVSFRKIGRALIHECGYSNTYKHLPGPSKGCQMDGKGCH